MPSGYDRFKLLILILFYENLSQNAWTVFGIRACKCKSMYSIFPIFAGLDVFPFWAVKILHFLSAPSSEGGWKFRVQTFYHMWKFAQDKNCLNTKVTVHRCPLVNA